jgi:hypothetical protein
MAELQQHLNQDLCHEAEAHRNGKKLAEKNRRGAAVTGFPQQILPFASQDRNNSRCADAM